MLALAARIEDEFQVVRHANPQADLLQTALDEARRGAAMQAGNLEDARSSMSDMATSVRNIASSVESLASSAEESGSSILEMSAINDEMADNIQELAGAVEETAASIEQMIYSIKEVAKNIEDLSIAAEQTSTSMSEMEASISHVEQNAVATSKLSEEVILDAQRGADAVMRTLSGIEEIRESSKQAGDVIRELGLRIGAIDNILTVIDDVAEQTNLLALNAAIIAAQSGEHGRGFAVVADEIKDLAERTAASTREIADLILDVQDRSKNAIAAINRGDRSVEAGVDLSKAAESALKEIVDSAGKSTEMVKAIALATVEQAKGARVVANAVERIARTVQQVAAATAEQARGSEQIMRSAERMKGIASHVELSSQEQAKGGRQVANAIDHINEMVRKLHTNQGEQARSTEQVLATIDGIQQQQQQQVESIESVMSTPD
ncbi:MAG: chemotaxis protein [Deltaproteobacteria bacterium]|nr:chemotaxis protein [Deltaproteobacteria bacterium]